MNIDEKITELQRQIDELRAQLTAPDNKVAQWEPMFGNYSMLELFCGSVTSSSEFTNAGMQRNDIDQAKRDAAELRRFARLLAYRAEFAPDYVVPEIGSVWHVMRNRRGIWEPSHWSESRTLDVFMPQDVAEELARKLNSGEVVL